MSNKDFVVEKRYIVFDRVSYEAMAIFDVEENAHEYADVLQEEKERSENES